MRWMWIDRVLELVPRERLVAIKNVSLAEEHLHDHFAADAELRLDAMPLMPMSLVVEGMAQSAGILVGHASGFQEKVVLAKVAKAELDRDPTPGVTLRYTATIQSLTAQGAATQGVVEMLDHARASEGFVRIGSIDLMFSQVDHNMSGLQFPEHNFVFSESFQTLLRTSGIDWPSA
ncbi:MAG: beta-hydroxyacyl-ACP dehydratase [Phycisphaerales bacterium]|nr:MAG: beta-hydroxyacyl-ACP dehydratase [Phycisphaerales bacterium]